MRSFLCIVPESSVVSCRYCSLASVGLWGAGGGGVFHRQGGEEHGERAGWRVEAKGKGHLFQDILRAVSWGIIYITRGPTAGPNLGCG